MEIMRIIENIPRIRLAHLPTPLEFCPGLSRRLDKNIYFKRDDLTGSVLSGNKVRKLEYLLADARLKRATAVMTCGATTSNHARATAIAARRAGFKPYLLLRRYEIPDKDYANANIYLERLAGAEIRFCSAQEYDYREKLMEEWAKALGENIYIIPEGGSNETGIIGYIDALREIKEECERISLEPDGIIVAVGSGGTYSGLLLGSVIYDWKIPVYGYSVYDVPEHFVNEVRRIITLFEARFGQTFDIQQNQIRIVDAAYGNPYGATTDSEWRLIREFAESYGIILDPVYTARAMHCFINNMPEGKTFIFLHTGGIFGLFSPNTLKKA